MIVEDFLASVNVKHPYCVLLGHPVRHSLSPFIQNTAAKLMHEPWHYEAVDVAPMHLPLFEPVFRNQMFCGANITIPYKQPVIPFLDDLDSLAETLGAVNTLFKKDNKLLGTNTDVYGFKQSLHDYAPGLKGKDAIVFGTGGASRAVFFALSELGIRRIFLVSRHPHDIKTESWAGSAERMAIGYDEWIGYTERTGIIVNATPLGMEPDIQTSPVKSEFNSFLNHKICYDIVYKPKNTRFLQQAAEAGGIPIGGLDMLIYQGGKSFEYWTNKKFPFQEVKKALFRYLYARY